MNDERQQGSGPNEALIQNHLRRAFQDKAREEIPDDLKALLEKLRMQDNQNGTS